MKYLKVASVLAGFLLAAGMGSANLLDSFGVVSGEANVEGPTFWTDSGEDLSLEDPGTVQGANPTADPGSNARWVMDDIGGYQWYNVSTEVKLVAKNGGEEAEATVRFARMVDGVPQDDDACRISNVNFDNSEFDEYTLNCDADWEGDVVEGFELRVIGEKNTVEIEQGGGTFVEVNAQ